MDIETEMLKYKHRHGHVYFVLYYQLYYKNCLSDHGWNRLQSVIFTKVMEFNIVEVVYK